MNETERAQLREGERERATGRDGSVSPGRVRRKRSSGEPRLGLKREGRGEECMGTDMGM